MTEVDAPETVTRGKKLPFPPLLQCVFFGIVGFALAQNVPSLGFQFEALFWVSIALVLAGLIVLLLSVRSFGKAGTTVNPIEPDKAGQLVTTGLYSFTRNPMYLGMLLVLLGGALGLQNIAAFSAPILYAISITRFQIIPEERDLVEIFGTAFSDYCSQTRRWI